MHEERKNMISFFNAKEKEFAEYKALREYKLYGLIVFYFTS